MSLPGSFCFCLSGAILTVSEAQQDSGARWAWSDIARFVKTLLASRFGRRGSFFLSHLITGRCNCSCPTCIWRDNEADELETSVIERLYRGANDGGFVANAIWGGEPLLRQDLGRLCRSSRENGMMTTVITNGLLLPDRAHEIGQEAHCIIVSLDYPESSGHDSFRGMPGLFARAVKGIETLKRMSSPERIVVNCLLHRGNENMMPQMAELARSLGVSLWVCPAKEGILRETGETNKETLASREAEQQAARELLDLKKRGYPINNSRTYLHRYLLNMTPYVCRVPFVYVTVTPEGNVTNCFNHDRPYGNVRTSPFDEIMKNWDHREVTNITKGCWKCNNPDVVDTSYICELRPEPSWNLLKTFLPK
ncbi:radical SAM protein [Chloroflexota bacterium]